MESRRTAVGHSRGQPLLPTAVTRGSGQRHPPHATLCPKGSPKPDPCAPRSAAALTTWPLARWNASERSLKEADAADVEGGGAVRAALTRRWCDRMPSVTWRSSW